MLQLRGDSDLSQEALWSKRRRQLRSKNLDGHSAIMLQVVRQVYRRHAPLTDLPLDSVAAGKGVSKLFEELSHEPGSGGRKRSVMIRATEAAGHPSIEGPKVHPGWQKFPVPT